MGDILSNEGHFYYKKLKGLLFGSTLTCTGAKRYLLKNIWIFCFFSLQVELQTVQCRKVSWFPSPSKQVTRFQNQQVSSTLEQLYHFPNCWAQCYRNVINETSPAWRSEIQNIFTFDTEEPVSTSIFVFDFPSTCKLTRKCSSSTRSGRVRIEHIQFFWHGFLEYAIQLYEVYLSIWKSHMPS